MTEALLHAVSDIKEWLREHRLERTVQALNPGAGQELFRTVEQHVGTTIPEWLCALYRIHDGQRLEECCFFEDMQFLPLEDAVGLERGYVNHRKEMLEAFFGVVSDGVARDRIVCLDDTIQDEECTDHWMPFANMSLNYLAVNLDTARVFRTIKGEGIRLEAPDLATYLGDYATRLWDDYYEIAGVPPELMYLTESATVRQKRELDFHLARMGLSAAEIAAIPQEKREELLQALQKEG